MTATFVTGPLKHGRLPRLMRNAGERGSLVVGLGDFNMVPMSFAHVLLESRGGGIKDVWRLLKPGSSVGASIDEPEQKRRRQMGHNAVPNIEESLLEHGHTCDSDLNTWRWSEMQRKHLEKGIERKLTSDLPDPKAKRLDYIFFGGFEKGWAVEKAEVCMTERHPTIRCSLSDHFAVYTKIVRSSKKAPTLVDIDVTGALGETDNGTLGTEIADIAEEDLKKVLSPLPTQSQLTSNFYEDILNMIHTYTLRERKQRRYRLSHFVGSAVISIGCFVATWWSPENFVAFILILLSSLGLMAGTVDGLIGGLFVGSELRALNEFEWEVRNALQMQGGPSLDELSLRDWYD